MKIDVDVSGLDGVLKTLQELPKEVASKRGGPVRAALRKGAGVIRKEARKNLTAAIGSADTGQGSTGFTAKNIVSKLKKPMDGTRGERIIVSVNYKQHPSGNVYKRRGGSKRAIRANDIAFMMEYGTATQPAKPWLRPAFEAKAAEAITTISTDLKRRVDLAVQKLAIKNKGST